MPSSSQEPFSCRVPQASCAVCACNSPVMASSKSCGVRMPCTSPYSSTTKTSRCACPRNCSSNSMPLMVSGTKIAGSATSSSVCAACCGSSNWLMPTMPTTSSSESLHTGYQECARISPADSLCSACATVVCASSHTTSLRGTMMEESARSSSLKTLRTMRCSCSSISPASTPSTRLAAISSWVTLRVDCVSNGSRRSTACVVLDSSSTKGRAARDSQVMGRAMKAAICSG